ncbi:hypothetical protein DH2020_032918 [Rehmannia glutinosa]|uniref:START domain-containing protein n=1 Tax=Rehmannia glutinosa TaxID=99300 RepID=A0ABR0VH73_REHGL
MCCVMDEDRMLQESKAQHERSENSQLRSENDKLRAENIRYKEALSSATCPNCGGPAAIGEMSFDEQHLRVENARLREEIDRISGIAAKYVGKPMLSYPHLSPGASRSLDLGVGNFGPQSGLTGEIYGAADLLRSVSGPTDADKLMIIELAVAAMEELIRMAQSGEPLWIPTIDSSGEALSEDEYVRTFPQGIGPKPLGLKSEASRESAVVIMNHINLVEILMDNQWSSVFSSIVSRAVTLEVLSTGVAGNYNGALQVMTAEFQVPSPLVPTRENYFVRYCKQHGDGTWAVVDVSLDNLRPTSISRCRRRPSGCLIQELPNGYSKVTWIEHVEVDDRAVHSIYKALVNSGLAFGARRWVAILDRQCERLASVMANNISAGDVGVISSPKGRKSMLKLAERMVMSFCTGVGASTAHTWTTLSGSGADDVRFMTRKSMDDPGRPPGIVLSAATSFWLPVPPKRVFDFLRDENSRSEWDILSKGGLVQIMAHIANGRDPGNSVSLLRVNILVDSVPTAKLSLGSVAAVNSFIKCTVQRIKGAVLCDAAGGADFAATSIGNSGSALSPWSSQDMALSRVAFRLQNDKHVLCNGWCTLRPNLREHLSVGDNNRICPNMERLLGKVAETIRR